MVVWLYTCSRCKTYQTNRKENMKRHMNRNKPCPISTRNQTLNDSQMTLINSQMTLNDSQMTLNDSLPDSQNIQFNCQHCNETFTRKNNLNRHIRKSCKEYKLKQEIARLQEENRLLQTRAVPINNITNNNNTINNTQNNTQNITINAYGKEDLQYLLPKIPMLIRHFPVSAVTDLICETYYDPDHPENKSVKIRSTKEKWAQVYNGDEWEMQKKFDVIMNVLQKSFEMIDELYESNNVEHPDYRQNKVTWDRVREMWINDEYPDKEMIDTTEEILTNQNQSHSDYRKCMQTNK